MAPTRHRKKNTSKTPPRDQIAQEKHLANVRYLTRSGRRPVDPTNINATARAAARLRRREALERNYGHKVNAAQVSELQQRGFPVNVRKRIVMVDGPRDARRKPIKGARVKVLQSGVVQFSAKERRDYVYGMTKQEKKEFLKDPDSFIKRIRDKLRKQNPNMRAVTPRKIRTRLQWGAFEHTKDFSPVAFDVKYLISVSPEDARKGDRRPRIDKLTGLRFVIHLPRKTKRNVKRGKKKTGAK